MTQRQRGFTLIEVTVALVVGGTALTAAATLFQGLGDRAEAIRAAAGRVDRAANAERLLRSAWANLRVGNNLVPAIRGDSANVAFQSWCTTTEGWMRSCSGRLAIEEEGGHYAIRLYMDTPARRPVTLWDGLPWARLRYLKEAANGGRWESRWSDIVIPPAVAVIAGADTLILAAW